MRLLAIVLALVASSTILPIKTQSPSDDSVRVTIQEHFTKVSGVTLDLPADWSVEHFEHKSDTYLYLRSGNDRMTLTETSLIPGEELHHAFKISLMGLHDGGGFIAVGEQTTTTVDKCDVVVQQLSKKTKTGDQFGVFRGFFSHDVYVQILHFGPKNTMEARESILKSLHIRL